MHEGLSAQANITKTEGPRRLPLILLIILLGAAHAPFVVAQGLPAGATSIPIPRSRADSLVMLPHQFLLAGTDSLIDQRGAVIPSYGWYTLDDRHGVMRFTDSAFVRFQRDSVRGPLTLMYRYLPLTFKDTYTHRTLFQIKDSTGVVTKVARPVSTFSVDDIFGSSLQKSGSIVRGVTVGSNRDLSLNSGLRLQLSGRIGPDVEVNAVLTDENTPIQPEGTTQTLQEFDKVFVEVRSSNVAATLGDFSLDLTGTEFARLSRKLQGAKITAEYAAGTMTGSTTVSGAITRGKYATNQFPGLEGIQGPYRLTGRNGERTIIVIAGTERVYIDGEQQTRGETNDYVIDYSTGEVTFTPRRLITSASRITIDFEYTDRQFSRSLLATQSSASFAHGRARVSVTWLREADDQDSPIDVTLSDSLKQILRAAGGDREKASVSGVTQVDSGGYYAPVDTLLPDGSSVRFYRYAPGNPDAKFNVVFSSVTFGTGDYIRQQIGVFVWKGKGNGDYVPIQYLPMPQLQQEVDVAIDGSPVDGLGLSGEFARSGYTPNRFSSVNSGGNAVTFGAVYAPKRITIGDASLGEAEIRFHERFVEGTFVPIDRTNDIEFSRKWGIDTVTQDDESIQEASLKYVPVPAVVVSGGYGKITRGDALRSVRNEGHVTVRDTSLPTIHYDIESVRSTETTIDNAGDWLRQKGSIEYGVGPVVPSFGFESENRQQRFLSSDLLRTGSFSFDSWTAGVSSRALGRISLSAAFGWRKDDVLAGSTLGPESRSATQSYVARLTDWNALTTSLDVTLRTKSYTEAQHQLGLKDINTVLVRNQTRYVPLNRGVETDFLYEVQTERSARLQRVFVRVTPGSGNYKYLGDVNGNGIADDNEFVLTRFDGDYIAITMPTDELIPIIDLKSSIRLRLTPARFLHRDGTGWEKTLSIFSSETYFRLEEKSSEPDLKQIYLFHLDKFRRDETTINGAALFTQDILFFEGQTTFSGRLHYIERKGLANFSGGIERSFSRERSLRVRWQLLPEVSNQFDYANRVDALATQVANSRTRDILTDDGTFDVSYRPEQNAEFGFKIELSHSTDRFPVIPVEVWLNAQSVRWVYAFVGAGQLRLEGSREEIRFSRQVADYPYELTGGRVAGQTWIWRAAFDYRVTSFLQATANYDGRVEGGAPPVHTARAEVRAFF